MWRFDGAENDHIGRILGLRFRDIDALDGLPIEERRCRGQRSVTLTTPATPEYVRPCDVPYVPRSESTAMSKNITFNSRTARWAISASGAKSARLSSAAIVIG